jgi:predicted ester cyclase
MSVEANKAVVRRAYEEGMTKHDLDVIHECFSPDYVCRFPDGTALVGRPQFLEFLTAFMDAFPDMVYTVVDAIAEGDKVAVRWVGTGTHTHPFRAFDPGSEGVPASGRKVRFVANDVYVVVDGQIVEEWNSLTDADVKFQIGVLVEKSGDAAGQRK